MTPQGNAIAYQAVKPVEITKVGDLYSNIIDSLVKDKKTKEAADLKRKTEEGKIFTDLMKDWKVDYKSTINTFQDASNKSVKDAIDKISFAKQIANNPNYSYEEKLRASTYAKNAMDSSLQLQSFLNNPKTQEIYFNNLKTIGSGKAFMGDERLGLYNSAAVGAWQIRNNDDGTKDVAFVNQNDTKDSPLNWRPLSEIMDKYSTPIEESQIDDYNKNLTDWAQKITTETTNDNGVVKTYIKKFDPIKATKLLASSFGYDPEKPLEPQFSINAVPIPLNQWYWQKTGKKIENNEDFKKAIDASVEQMKAAADEKYSREVKQTDLDIELKKAELQKKKKDINKTDNNEGNTISPVMGSSPVQIKSNRGVILGTQNWNVGSFTLPKKKGMPGTDNVFGVSKVQNKDGNVETIYLMGAPAPTGDNVYSRVKGTDIVNYAAKLGYSLKDIQNIFKDINPTVTKYNGKILRAENKENKDVINPFSKVQISFKTKQYASDDDGL